MIYTVTLNPSLDRTLSVPEMTFNEVLRSTSTRLDISGKGLNVSLALKELGCANTAVGYLGGATGIYLEQGLRAAGIPCDFIPISGETRSNVMIIEESTQRYVKANEAGPAISSIERQALIDRLTRLAVPGDYWVFSGSLPPGLQAGFYAELIELVQSKGSLAVLDSSTDMLRLGVTARPCLVKPNALEAEQASQIPVNSPQDAVLAARWFLDQGVRYVAISLGEDGLLFASKETAIHVSPPKVQVVNPTAAGDALLAGLVWAFQNQASILDVARWGVASGTAAAMQAGSGTGSRALIEDLFRRTTSYHHYS
jgi:1-phosphofructokinase family hexose kinase